MRIEKARHTVGPLCCGDTCDVVKGNVWIFVACIINLGYISVERFTCGRDDTSDQSMTTVFARDNTLVDPFCANGQRCFLGAQAFEVMYI